MCHEPKVGLSRRLVHHLPEAGGPVEFKIQISLLVIVGNRMRAITTEDS